MKLVLFALVALTASCSTYSKQSHQTGIRDQEAINSAKAEIARRKLTLPDGSIAKVSEGTVIVEVDAEVPIYVVAFYAPGHRRSNPLYQVSINRRTGTIEDFTDSRTLIPAGRR